VLTKEQKCRNQRQENCMADLIIHNQLDHNQHFAFYEVNNEVAAMFVAAGIATYAPKKAAPKAPPEWCVLRNKYSDVPFIEHRVGATRSAYEGPAAAAKNAFPTCPQAIIDELADAQRQLAVAQQNAARASEQARNRL
jgi:hypothetical protein